MRSTWNGLRDALIELQDASRHVAAGLVGSEGDRNYLDAVGRLSSALADLQELAVEPTAGW